MRFKRRDKCLLFPFTSLHLGSLVDLHDFYEHTSTTLKPGFQRPYQFEIYFEQKCLKIQFRYKSFQTGFRIKISFESIKWMIIDPTNKRLVFEVRHVPLFYRLDGRRECRVNSLQPNYDDPDLLGMCRTYLIQFPTIKKFVMFYHLANICKSENKKFNFYLTSIKIHEAQLTYRLVLDVIDHYCLPFPIVYALLALFTTSYKVLDSLSGKEQFVPLIDFIREKDTDAELVQSILEETIFAVKNIVRENEIVDIFPLVQKIFLLKYLGRSKMNIEDKDQPYFIIRRAFVSVSHVEFTQGIPLRKSRFNELANVDYAIRVQVLEDNNERLSCLQPFPDNDHGKKMLKKKLLQGFKIGQRKYEFLGSSSSQMKEHGIVYYAPDPQGRTPARIRADAGDLRAFSQSVPKYVARFGLIFSQSMKAIKINPGERRLIKDIEGEIKEPFGVNKENLNLKEERYCFTDGIGIVSESVARRFHKDDDYFPSAFQIRNGGSKGVLAVYPLAEPVIAIRESMQKFESDDQEVRILKSSYPRSVFLNRQLINILAKMNTGRDVFYGIVKESIINVANALLSNRQSLRLVNNYTSAFIPYQRLRSAHVKLLDEPFYRSLVNYLIHYRLKELKTKGRMRVPMENGRHAFGVVDETGQLNPGEIFFQYTVVDKRGHPTNETRILQTNVMVTKFPCLQPGDVRIFTARRPRNGALDHIKDCVVFPAKGPRPHPDEMAGSDLDGDEYAIFWDTPLCFPNDNQQPMVFPYGMNKKKLEGEINDDDIIDFYCEYFIHENMGMVANNHLMFSDLHPYGLDAQECFALALEYSMALDFQKTGYFPPVSSMYTFKLRPDFMVNQPFHRYYLSKRILGQTYRNFELIEKAMSLSEVKQTYSARLRKADAVHDQRPTPPSNIMKRTLIIEGWQEYRVQAEDAYKDYLSQMRQILDQLNIENETILLSDVYENKEEASTDLMHKLIEHFRAKFQQQCLDCGISKRRYKRKKKKVVVAEEDDNNKGEDEEEVDDELQDDNEDGNDESEDSDEEFERKVEEHQRERYSKPHKRNQLISAWYAIVFENQSNPEYRLRGQPLYGLPWLLYNEMIFLSRFVWYKAREVKLSEQARGEAQCPQREVIQLGEDWQHNRKLVENSLTYNMVRALGLVWFKNVRAQIGAYNNNKAATINSYRLRYSRQTITENDIISELIEEFIKTNIDEVLEVERTRTTRRVSMKLPLQSKLFNSLMSFMFSVSGDVNNHIGQRNIKAILILKYVIFAHECMTKFNDDIDGYFASRVLAKTVTHENFHEEIDAKFRTLVGGKHFPKETIKFDILLHQEKDSKRAELFESANLPHKLKTLTGLPKIVISPEKDEAYRKIIVPKSKENNHERDLAITQYDVLMVECRGCPLSISLLQVLLGHPDFGDNILKGFEVVNE